MKSLNELNEAVKQVIEVTNKVINEINVHANSSAPLIVHQRLCAELRRIMKEQPTKIPKDVPEAMDVLIAISILEKCYPVLTDTQNN